MRVFASGALFGAVAVMAATALAQVPKRPVAEQTNAGATIAPMTAQLLDWNGTAIPAGQECKQFGGNGSTPRIAVSNYHAGAQAILLAFNDETYGPMDNGGHGVIGFRINGRYASTGPVAGETDLRTQGNFIVADNRGGQSPGYLPPCSGGRGNLYTVTVMAVTWADTNPPSYTVLNQTKIELGRY